MTLMRKAAVAVAIATAAVLGCAVQVQAADKGGPAKFDEIAAPAAKKPNWTGLWVGVVGSYDMQSTQLGGVVTFNDKDLGYGIAAGADYRFTNTNIVAGIAVDYMKANTGTPLSALDGSWSVTGRLGFVIGDTTLLYGLAGYTIEDTNGLAAALNLDKGFTAGIGIESFVTQRLTLKAEYRWVDEGTAGGGMVESNSQALRFGVNYRF
jgi:outer membrane immunogenic protein